MILRNPVEETITVTIFGTTYTVKPNDTIEVPQEVGEYWKTLHGFLKVEQPKQEKQEKEEKEEKEVKTKK